MAENSKVDVYSVYVKKFFRAIPKNSVLITRDPNFNGNYVKVKKGGFAFVRPWAESKFIYVGIQNRDYEKMEFDDKDSQPVYIDFVLSIRIVDPEKYEYSTENVEDALKARIQSLIGTAVKKATWEELAGKDIKLPKNNDIKMDPRFQLAGGVYYYRDSAYKNDKGEWKATPVSDFDIELFNIRREIDDFAFKNGIEVVGLYKKEVQQSKEMQEFYNKKLQARLEMEARLIEAQNEKEIAEVKAQTRQIEAQAEADARAKNINSIIAGMKGMPADKISNAVNSYILTNGANGANIYAAINGSDVVQSGIIGGVTAANEQKQKTK